MFLGRAYRKLITTCFKTINWSVFRNAILYDVPTVYFKENLRLGTKVTFNNNVFIHAAGGVEIGDNSVLSYGATILSTSENSDLWVNRKVNDDIHINAPVVVGRNVWLCANTTVCPGVTIADNCIVAAGAVVVDDLREENTLYAGIPAKKVRRL